MFKVGIIGCGDMGKNHAQAWSGHPLATVTAISDPDAERMTTLQASTPAGEQIQSFNRWQDLIAAACCDIISVCTPACFHAPISIAAAKAGQHVLCEKPMALTLDEADAMLAAAEANGTTLAIAHQYRWNPHNQTMLQHRKELGSPLYVRFFDAREVRPKNAMHSQRLSGGPIQDMTGHWFDLMQAFTERKPISVRANGTIYGQGKARLAEVDDLAPDTADIQVLYDDGHVCSVGISWGLPKKKPAHGGTIITGPDGLIRDDGKVVTLHNADGTQEVTQHDAPDARQAIVTDFIEALQAQRQPTITGAVGRQALAVSLAALDSLATGQEVCLA